MNYEDYAHLMWIRNNTKNEIAMDKKVKSISIYTTKKASNGATHVHVESIYENKGRKEMDSPIGNVLN